MTRTVLLCLCAAVAFGAAAGCGSTPDTATAGNGGDPLTYAVPVPEGRAIVVETASEPGTDVGQLRTDADHAARTQLADRLGQYTRGALAEFFAADARKQAARSPVRGDFVAAMEGEVTAGILRRALPQKSWQDDERRMRVLYEVAFDDVNRALIDNVAPCLENINPFGAPAEQVAGNLSEFLAARTRRDMTEEVRTRPPDNEVPVRERVPQWLGTGRHEEFPQRTFLCAIGLGRSTGEADQVGMAELVQHANAGLRRFMREARAPDTLDPLALNVAHRQGPPPRFDADELHGCRIGVRWYDAVTRTQYVYAVMDRTEAAGELGKLAAAAFKKSADLTASSGNHDKAGNHVASLRDQLEAMAAARDAVALQLKAIAVARTADVPALQQLCTEPVLLQTQTRAAEIIDRVSLAKVAGDGQWTPPGTWPREPLIVKATMAPDEGPLAGLPLRLQGAGGAVLARAVTDKNGVAALRLRSPLPAAPRADLVARPDIETLAPAAAAAAPDDAGPAVTFHCVVRSRANTRFAVVIAHGKPGGEVPLDPMARQLKEAITEQGFRLVDDAAVLKHVPAGGFAPDATNAHILKAFQPLAEEMKPEAFLVVVVGHADPHLAQTVRAQDDGLVLHIVHCPYSLRVLDCWLPPRAGALLALEGTGRAAEPGPEREAARRAVSEAAVEAAKDLAAGLRRTFGAPPLRAEE